MHHPRFPRRLRGRAGFTLVEVLIGAGMLVIMTSATMMALMKMNEMAAVARNMTGASTAVQNQIDLILSDGPFNPQKTNPDGSQQVPPELQLGTQTQTNVPVYQDPKSGIVVPGTMTTTVTDVSFIFGTFQIWTYRATVTCTWTYRNKNYSYAMSTMRTSDI